MLATNVFGRNVKQQQQEQREKPQQQMGKSGEEQLQQQKQLQQQQQQQQQQEMLQQRGSSRCAKRIIIVTTINIIKIFQVIFQNFNKKRNGLSIMIERKTVQFFGIRCTTGLAGGFRLLKKRKIYNSVVVDEIKKKKMFLN
uniref:Uncharacterized protein n=1 Tax=Onchocerca volvulus TaxID=6282 RepID=A0A8R1XVI5_ONCVO